MERNTRSFFFSWMKENETGVERGTSETTEEEEGKKAEVG